jgi:chromosome segregation ATPase
MRAWCRQSAFLAAAMLIAALPAFAADKKSDGTKEQLKRLQQSQRKLEQEKSQLARDKAAVDGQLKEAQDKLDEAGRKAQGAAARAAVLDRELKAAKAEKESLAGKLAETEKKLAETGEALRKAEAAGRQLDAGLKQTAQSLGACEAKNEKLHGYGTELLRKYEAKGCGEAMLQAEPFTGLKRVEIENYAEDTRDRLDEQKLDRTVRR